MNKVAIKKSRGGGLERFEDSREARPVAAYLANLSEGSRRGQLTALRAAIAAVTDRETIEVDTSEVAAWNWSSMSAAHVGAIRSKLENRHSPAYGNKILSAVAGVLKAYWRLGLLSRDDYARAIDVPRIRGESLPAGRDISAGEVALLMQVCEDDHDALYARDSALIALGATIGYRIAEASGMNLEDYDTKTGRIVLRGKGRKERSVFCANGAKNALDDWIELRGSEPGTLFMRIRKSGEIIPLRISTSSLGRMLKKRQVQAGIKPFSWHDMRRTCAGDLLDSGTDLVTVQKILGHANPSTTSRYDRRPEGVKQAAIARLSVPYRKRVHATGA
ncbi:Tyrosine recombinase XerC [subsurface metagenome]